MAYKIILEFSRELDEEEIDEVSNFLSSDESLGEIYIGLKVDNTEEES